MKLPSEKAFALISFPLPALDEGVRINSQQPCWNQEAKTCSPKLRVVELKDKQPLDLDPIIRALIQCPKVPSSSYLII